MAILVSTPETARAAGVFNVTTTADGVDANPGNGTCATGGGACTLRAAIQESNALVGSDVINVPAGTYQLTLGAAGEDLAAAGDLDITGPVTIAGAGAASTSLVSAGNDRVVHLLETAGNVTLSGLTIRGGVTEEDGGGIYSTSAGTVILDGVTVTANSTGSDGGGIHTVTGTLRVRNGSIVSGNSGRNGGGIYNAGELSLVGVPSNVIVSNATITGNRAIEGGGGGIWNDHEGSLTVTDTVVSDNFAGDAGGGIAVVSKSSLTLTRGTISGNTSHGDGGGIFTGAERRRSDQRHHVHRQRGRCGSRGGSRRR